MKRMKGVLGSVSIKWVCVGFGAILLNSYESRDIQTNVRVKRYPNQCTSHISNEI